MIEEWKPKSICPKCGCPYLITERWHGVVDNWVCIVERCIDCKANYLKGYVREDNKPDENGIIEIKIL